MNYKKIKQLENSPLDIKQKTEILLIYADQKPATILYMINKDKLHPENQMSKTEKLLDKLNLKYKNYRTRTLKTGFEINNSGDIINFPKYEVTYLAVAKNDNTLKQIISADNLGDDYELGKLYGFPKTAIEAYLGMREPFLRYYHKNDIERYFTQFIFSKEFFKEEFKSTSLRWHDTVKRLSSKIYDQINEWCNCVTVIKGDIAWR